MAFQNCSLPLSLKIFEEQSMLSKNDLHRMKNLYSDLREYKSLLLRDLNFVRYL